jgi:hypothetical protein
VSKKIVLFALAVCTALSLSGCGGSSKPLSIAITASSSTVDGSDSVTLTAAVTNDKNSAGVSWAITSGGGTLSSQTTTSAKYTAPAATSSQQTITITATSVAKSTQTGTITITVPAAPAVTTTSANLTGAVGSAFSVKLAASGGIPPFTWALGSGTTLPACLTLKSDGTLTTANGLAPNASCAGSYTNLTFKATDSGTPNPLSVTSAPLTVTITAPSLAFSPTLPGGNVGVAYVGSVAATGVIGASTYTIASGALPADLSLNASTGAITGTPKASDAGTFNFTVMVVDAYGDTATSGSLSITITAPTITFTPSLPAGTVGTAYTGSVAATGPVGASTYTVASGSLSADLSLNSSTGAITGTPKASDAGTVTFTIKVVDAYGDTATSGSLSIAIAAATAISFTGSVPATGTYNVAFTGSAAASGGAGALTYSISAGALPGDLSLNASTGAITGTPSKSTDVGVFNFTVQAADAYGDSATQAYTLTISYAAMSITTSTLPTGYVNGMYPNETLAATGGTGLAANYQWQVSGGALPGGLTLSTAGLISGTIASATTTGTYNFTAKVTDTVAGISGTANLSIVVDAGVSITTSSLPTGYVGSAYTSTTLQASGGTGTGYQWIVTGGTNLPSGLTLSLAGVLGGTPANTGTTSVTFQVTDSVGNSATASLSITVDAGVSITAPALASAYPGTAYTSAAFTASGGSGTGYTWSWAPAGGSTLPNGLSIGSSTGIVSGTPANTGTTSVTSSVVVTATDSVGNKGSATVSITIEATLTVTTPTTLNAGTAGVSYSQGLAASGGSATGYTWSTDAAGTTSLAGVGLTLAVNGTVAGASPTLGTATFTATVKDSENHTANATFTVDINNQLKINQTTLPDGDAGSSYSQTLTASGGSGSNYTFTATSSNLSTFGLTLATDGSITGTPSQSGTVSFTANVKDGANNTATQALTININGALILPNPNPSSLPSGYTGVSYTGDVAASGGSGTYCYSVVSGLPSDGLSGPANNSICGYVAASFPVSGTPTAAATVSFTLKVTDSLGNSVTTTYTITVTNPTPVTLPATNPSSLPSATVNQAYNGAIDASGGVSPYTWSINGTTVTSGGISVGNGLSASSTGGSTLSITGSPTATGTVNLNLVKVTDSLSSSATQSYTITVNSAGQNVSGQINLNNNCGGGSTNLSVFTVTITNVGGTTFTQNVTTDSNGNYTFSGVPNGTYTITPTLTTSGPSVVFYPATLTGVAVNNAGVSGENFNVSLGFTVSGTITYSGTTTQGRVYINLVNGNCGGSGGNGTSIAYPFTAGGAFSIQGVPPGSYTLKAWMDPTAPTNLGEGTQNTSDPTGSAANAVTVAAGGVQSGNGQSFGLTDPTVTAGTTGPKFKTIAPGDSGAVIAFSTGSVSNSNGIEEYTSYTVQWSTTTTFSSSNQATFKAIGSGANVWILHNGNNNFTGSLSNGTAYYFRAMSTNSAGSTGWSYWAGAGVTCATTTCATTATIGAPTTGNTVSGVIIIPSGVTINAGAVLYAGVFDQNTNTAYADAITAPVNTSGGNAFTVHVPSDTNYQVFGILDQNKDGLIDAGDVTNVNTENATILNITGNLTVANTTLPGTSTISVVQTDYQSVTSSGGASTSYTLNFDIRQGNKLPVAVTLTGGPNVISPVDISNYCQGCGNVQFQTNASIQGDTPAVGDAYTFKVTYSDGTSDSAVTAAVTGWDGGTSVVGASDLATSMLPSGSTGPGSGTRTQPNFTWTFPANPSNFTYQFDLYNGSNNSDIWHIPSYNSKSNGFTYAQTSGGSGTTGTITWGTDPTGDGSNTPSVSSLTTGTTYNWLIEVQDSNGNQAQAWTYYVP